MISIIVPVYDVERYVSKCIDSILMQTYTDFELLLIDDGSKDHSGTICDEYAGKDGRIRVYHKQNGGLSDARNYGLDRMKGDYITFIDSDDYIGKDYLKTLLDLIEANDADISVVRLEVTHNYEIDGIPSAEEPSVLSGEEAFQGVIDPRGLSESACAKLYRKDVFRSKRFPTGKIYEDYSTIPYLVLDCKKCVYSKSVHYFYFQREGSITKSATPETVQMCVEATDKILDYTRHRAKAVNRAAKAIAMKHIFSNIVDWYLYSDDYYPVARRIRKRYLDVFLAGVSLPGLTTKERMKALLFLSSIRMYRIIRRRWIERGNNPDTIKYLDSKL